MHAQETRSWLMVRPRKRSLVKENGCGAMEDCRVLVSFGRNEWSDAKGVQASIKTTSIPPWEDRNSKHISLSGHHNRSKHIPIRSSNIPSRHRLKKMHLSPQHEDSNDAWSLLLPNIDVSIPTVAICDDHCENGLNYGQEQPQSYMPVI